MQFFRYVFADGVGASIGPLHLVGNGDSALRRGFGLRVEANDTVMTNITAMHNLNVPVVVWSGDRSSIRWSHIYGTHVLGGANLHINNVADFVIEQSMVGVGPDGMAFGQLGLDNPEYGIITTSSTTNITIRRCLVGGHYGSGVYLRPSVATVEGCIIGLSADGSTTAANTFGIHVVSGGGRFSSASSTGGVTIGSIDPSTKTVISGNLRVGIFNDADNTVIVNTLIGTAPDGVTARGPSGPLGNQGTGIDISTESRVRLPANTLPECHTYHFLRYAVSLNLRTLVALRCTSTKSLTCTSNSLLVSPDALRRT